MLHYRFASIAIPTLMQASYFNGYPIMCHYVKQPTTSAAISSTAVFFSYAPTLRMHPHTPPNPFSMVSKIKQPLTSHVVLLALLISLSLRFRVSLHYTTFHSFQFHSFQHIAPLHSNSLTSFHFTSHRTFLCIGICHCFATQYLVSYRQITKYTYTASQIHNTLQTPHYCSFHLVRHLLYAMLLLNTMLYFTVSIVPAKLLKKQFFIK